MRNATATRHPNTNRMTPADTNSRMYFSPVGLNSAWSTSSAYIRKQLTVAKRIKSETRHTPRVMPYASHTEDKSHFWSRCCGQSRL
jgi:hypothetical protein